MTSFEVRDTIDPDCGSRPFSVIAAINNGGDWHPAFTISAHKTEEEARKYLDTFVNTIVATRIIERMR
jgi:hypothetical protein